MRAVRVRELPEESRLADAGIARDGDELALALAGLLERVAQLSTSISRPTNGVRPRAASACRRERSGAKRTISNTSTGAGMPLTGTGPSGFTSTYPSASAACRS